MSLDKDNELKNGEELENTLPDEAAAPEEPAEDAAAPQEDAPAEAPADGADGEPADEAGEENDLIEPADPSETEALLNEVLAEDAAEEDKQEQKPKKKRRLDSRKFRYGSTATAVTAVVVVLVVVLNVVVGILADRYPITIDLTQNKLFTLSDNSVEMARSIQKDVKVTVFNAEDVFKNPTTQYEQVNDVLREFYTAIQQYNNLTGGKVTVEYLDLNLNPTLSTQYEEYDVAEGSILFTCGDRHRTITINDLYTAEALDYYGYNYSYTSRVELALATNLKYVTEDERRVITVLTGHNEFTEATTALQEVYEANGYEFAELNLATSAEIDEDTVSLLIMAPAVDYSVEEIERLQTYLDNEGKLGRNLMVFVDPTASCPNLYEFLNVEYGIEVTDNLVYETDTNRTMQMNGYLGLADLESTDYTQEIAGEGTVLAVQTRQLLTHRENNTDNSLYNVDILTMPETAKLIPFEQASEGGNIDEITQDAEEYPVIGMAAATKWTYDNDAQETVETNVLVSGSVYMLGYLQTASLSNEQLMLNSINVMTGTSAETIDISTKSLDTETVEFSDTTTLVVGLGVFTLGVPVVTLIICLVVFLRRRHL